MIIPPNPHTSTRWAARWNPWNGSRWERLWGLFAGVLPDAYREAVRVSARMMLPIDGVHPEAIPPMLRRFGLPAYLVESPLTAPAGYAAALARILDAWNTHAVAGSTAGMETELSRAGVAGATIVNITGTAAEGADFAISVPTSTAGATYDGGAVFDDGTTFDRQVTATESQGIAAVIRHFKPARSLFRRLDP